jgi:hypothetical protein
VLVVFVVSDIWTSGQICVAGLPMSIRSVKEDQLCLTKMIRVRLTQCL